MMTADRRKELALKVVEHMFIKRGIPGGSQLKQDLGNMVAEMSDDVTREELMELYLSILPKLIGRASGCKKISLGIGESDTRLTFYEP